MEVFLWPTGGPAKEEQRVPWKPQPPVRSTVVPSGASGHFNLRLLAPTPSTLAKSHDTTPRYQIHGCTVWLYADTPKSTLTARELACAWSTCTMPPPVLSPAPQTDPHRGLELPKLASLASGWAFHILGGGSSGSFVDRPRMQVASRCLLRLGHHGWTTPSADPDLLQIQLASSDCWPRVFSRLFF